MSVCEAKVAAHQKCEGGMPSTSSRCCMRFSRSLTRLLARFAPIVEKASSTSRTKLATSHVEKSARRGGSRQRAACTPPRLALAFAVSFCQREQNMRSTEQWRVRLRERKPAAGARRECSEARAGRSADTTRWGSRRDPNCGSARRAGLVLHPPYAYCTRILVVSCLLCSGRAPARRDHSKEE